LREVLEQTTRRHAPNAIARHGGLGATALAAV
jgi:hypothetical protein